MTTEQVYLIKNASGENNCPEGKIAFYTHVDFNADDVGDILIVSPGIQLDEKQLTDYGFPVGSTSGISSVVNKMSIDASLISGRFLNGEILVVSANNKIRSLAEYTLGTGTWNDSVNSIVSDTVKTVQLKMSIEKDISLYIDDIYYVTCIVENHSDIDISDCELQITSSAPDIVSSNNSSIKTTLSANNKSIIRLPVTGIKKGSATITCRLYTPIGIINSGDNIVSSQATVIGTRYLHVTQKFDAHWKAVWDKPEYIYSYTFIMSTSTIQVDFWELSFALPEKAVISPDWLKTNSSWLSLNTEKSKDGMFFLDSIKGHVIAPNKQIQLDIQIIYPGESKEYEVIKNLRLEQLR